MIVEDENLSSSAAQCLHTSLDLMFTNIDLISDSMFSIGSVFICSTISISCYFLGGRENYLSVCN